MIRMIKLSSEPPPEAGDGALRDTEDDGEANRGKANGKADPGAVDDPAEQVADVAVSAENMLRLGLVAAQQMNTGRRALLDVLDADQHLHRVVGREQRRRHGNGHHRADKDQTDHPGLAPQQSPQGGFPQGRGAAEQLLRVLALGKSGGGAFEGGNAHSNRIRESRKP